MRRGLLSTFFVILAACSSPGPPVKPAGDATAAKVTLSYGWQPGLEAQVEVMWSWSERTVRGESKLLLNSSYRLQTAAEGKDLWIRSSNVRSTPEPGNLTPGTQPGDFAPLLSTLVPDLRVAADGKSVQVHDAPEARARVRALTTELFTEELPPGWMTSLETTSFSDRALDALAADFWNGLVATWLDGKMEIGRTYTDKRQVDNMVYPDKHLSLNYEYTATQIVPCKRGPRELRCVELRMRALSGPADTDRVASELLRDGQMTAAKGQTYSGLTTEYTNVLVTEPESLIPHAFTHTTVAQGATTVDGESQPVRAESRVEYSFTY